MSLFTDRERQMVGRAFTLQSVRLWEKGISFPRESTVRKIAEVLGTDTASVFRKFSSLRDNKLSEESNAVPGVSVLPAGEGN